jgi:type IV pilus assembly protein PilB
LAQKIKKERANLSYTLAKLGSSPTERSRFQRAVPAAAVKLEDYDIEEESSSWSRRCAKSTRSPPALGSSLIAAMADPTNLHAIDDIKF